MLADRKQLQDVPQNEFYRQKEAGTRKLYLAKKQIVYSKVAFLWGITGVYQADYLTSAEEVIPN